MSFLMGLKRYLCSNERTNTTHGTASLITKVFSLIVQKKRDKKVGSQQISETNTTMAFAAKHDGHNLPFNTKQGQKKERPYCTPCKYHGHTIEKCYTLHKYPPSFKQRQRNLIRNSPSAMVNQVTTHSPSEDKFEKSDNSIGNISTKAINQSHVNEITS